MKNPVRLARHLALVEGVSFLILLGIAMPLKYAAGMPMAVKVVGWAHGMLFVAFCFALLHVMMTTNWTMKRGALVFVVSLLPFGPFFLDRRMRQWEAEPQERREPPSEVG
jgi:integral membrane protein